MIERARSKCRQQAKSIDAHDGERLDVLVEAGDQIAEADDREDESDRVRPGAHRFLERPRLVSHAWKV